MKPKLKSGRVISKDGTPIAYAYAGQGPGLIIVPGVMAMAQHYTRLAQILAQQFEVYIIERRGRGESGPQGNNYSMAKECEDIAALQAHTKARFLFGHSYGGLIALEAAGVVSFEKIAVYEPGVSIQGSINTSWLAACESYLSQKKYLHALALITVEGGPKQTRPVPLWLMRLTLVMITSKRKRQQLYALIPPNIPEQGEIRKKNDTYRRYKELTVKALLMYGGKTKLAWPFKAIEALQEVLPYPETKKFGKLDHFGPVKSSCRSIAPSLANYFKLPDSTAGGSSAS